MADTPHDTDGARAADAPEQGELGGGRGPRTAVVFIHGQGEQRPMQGVRELARTVWATDAKLAQAKEGRPSLGPEPDPESLRMWSTPDQVSDLYEMRRLATESLGPQEVDVAGQPDQRRFDFYEFYWAHLMKGTQLSHVAGWFFNLLNRNLVETPQPLRPVRQAIVRFAELSALFAAAFAVLTSILIVTFNFPETRRDTSEAFAAAGVVLSDPFGQQSLSAAWQTLGIAAAPAGLIVMGVIVIPLALFWFVWSHKRLWPVSERRDLKAKKKNRAKRGAKGQLDALRKQAARGLGSLSTTTRLGVLLATIGLFFVVGVIAPSFEWRDVPAILGAVSVVIVCLAERRRSVLVLGYMLTVGVYLALLTQTPDGTIIGGLMAGALGAVVLAWRMNLQPAMVVATLTIISAVATRAAMAPVEGVYQAAFDPDFSWVLWFSWTYFYGLAAAFILLVPGASRPVGSRVRRLVWVFAIAAVAGYLQSHYADLLEPAPWSQAFGLPQDAEGYRAEGVWRASVLTLQFWLTGITVFVAGAIAALLVAANKTFLSPVMGDSARYLQDRPENIDQRQAIRRAGVELLEKLHDEKPYDRIIVVAHSLGSVVGYDVLTLLWGRRCDKLHQDGVVAEALRRVEQKARLLVMEDAKKVRNAARDVAKALGVLGWGKPRPFNRYEVIEEFSEPDERKHELKRQFTRFRLMRAAEALEDYARIGREGVAFEEPKTRKEHAQRAAAFMRAGPAAYHKVAESLAAIAETLVESRNKRHREAGERLNAASAHFASMAEGQANFRAAQRVYFEALRTVKDPKTKRHVWRISDFVTLGSPLNYGPFLLADSYDEFAMRKRDREFPTCPPYMEKEPPRASGGRNAELRFSYKKSDGSLSNGPFGPGHGALFGGVRWTNLYFESAGLVAGDIIAGPCWPHFDFGVQDVLLPRADTGELFAHNAYWQTALSSVELLSLGEDELPAHIQALRRALDLKR